MATKSVLNLPTAYIGVNKNRLKIYDNKVVFLENGQEFQFELHNPTKDVIGVNIWINGDLTSTSQLVLRPGESTWLDRYLDNPNKYIFETYNVDDTHLNREAIKENGKIKIEFYKEQKRNLLYGNGVTFTSSPTWFNTSTDVIYTTYDYSSDTNFGNSINCSCDMISDSGKLETGRVGEGGYSNQQFSSVYYNFQSTPFYSIEYQILPSSQKNAVSASEVRKYCTNCGSRVKRSNWKYCPTCGEKI